MKTGIGQSIYRTVTLFDQSLQVFLTVTLSILYLTTYKMSDNIKEDILVTYFELFNVK